jgi:ubiquinone/menaquinone biosynthesis C-methylase UbiE
LIDWQKAVPQDMLHLVRPETRSKYFPQNRLRQYLLTRFFNQVLALVRKSGAESILDAGSGEGLVDYFLLKEDLQLCIWGGDADSEVLNLARRMNPSGLYIPLDVRALPFQAGSFDLVMMNEVLEHLSDYERAIAEAERVTRRFAIFTVPEWPLYQASNFLIMKNLRNFGEHPDHVIQFSANLLKNKLEKRFSRAVEIRKSFPWIIVMACK